MIPVPQQDLIISFGQFEIISFKGLVSPALNRLQCLDIAAPDVGVLRPFLIDLFIKIDGVLEIPDLDFLLGVLVHIVRLFLYLAVSVPPVSVPPVSVPPVLLLALYVAALSLPSRRKKGTERKAFPGRE